MNEMKEKGQKNFRHKVGERALGTKYFVFLKIPVKDNMVKKYPMFIYHRIKKLS